MYRFDKRCGEKIKSKLLPNINCSPTLSLGVLKLIDENNPFIEAKAPFSERSSACGYKIASLSCQ